ncbi:hypothetical protein [Stomatohabitans albus]|uniref:hypothetical protein n=1 Tax=Stomatohabitans albus TaxID=3110766 RepID=UPI00300D913E
MVNPNPIHIDNLIGPFATTTSRQLIEQIHQEALIDKCERLASIWYSPIKGRSIAEELNLFEYLKHLDSSVNPYNYFEQAYRSHPEYFSIDGLRIDSNDVFILFDGANYAGVCEFNYDLGEFAAEFQGALIRNVPHEHNLHFQFLKQQYLSRLSAKPER